MRYLLLILGFHILCFAYSQELQFYQEKLDFKVSENEFMLNGLYYFRNSSPDTIKQFILYPFPQSPGLGAIKSVQMEALYPEQDTLIMQNFNQNAASFKLKVYPNDSAIIHIVYKQATPENKAEYILTSTNLWQQPLDKAYFALTLPFDMKVDSLSFDADELIFSKSLVNYYWNFTEFKPDRNFFVSFSKIVKAKN